MGVSERPLRRDAERNRQRILEAARELFAERGLGVTLNDIAHHAGVGVGTVYRRFPDKQQLIDALFEQQFEEFVELMDAALDDPDPWQGFAGFLERALELQAGDRGLRELILGAPGGRERVARLRARLYPLGVRLVERAREAGQLRADCEVQDAAILQMMLGFVIDAAHDVEPELWRRYLGIVLQGLRANPGPPPSLAPPALSEERMDEVLLASRNAVRRRG
jgi:AcrR family transcriptional regulator